MDNFIAVIKGVSGSGKSSRTFQLLKFFESLGMTFEDFKYVNKENKEKIIGILVKEMNIVFIGKIYKSGEIERWQGYDIVTGYFLKSEYFSDFLKDNSDKYSFIVEGAGVTGTNRLRPLFLNNFCGFTNIFIQYYNYHQDQKEQYLERIISRSGKVPGKGTMWDKASGFDNDHRDSLKEVKSLKIKSYVDYSDFDTPIEHLGCELLNFCEYGKDIIEAFKQFVTEYDYISKNKFENFSEPVLKTVEDKKMFIEGITNPKIPNENLIKAQKKYKESSKEAIISGDSIFDVLSLDRSKVKWEDHIYELTPVQKVGDMYFKREDMFAPLGYGGINGSKLRQAIFLVSQFANGSSTLISGASVKSPQLSMSTAVARHFGLSSHHIIGATKEETCMSKEMVQMATWFGATFSILKVGYNPVLQSEVNRIVKNDISCFKLPYGIAIPEDESEENITNFHEVGANQVKNIPDCIETIIIPAGSCNSCISILYGLSKKKPINLKDVILIGVGPNKLKFIKERLELIGKFKNMNTMNFESSELIGTPDKNSFNLMYIDINSIPKYDYQNEVKFSYHDIIFHPTYEGKVMHYINENFPELMNETTLFWIIGSKPYIKNMEKNCKELGNIPIKVSLSDYYDKK